MFNLITRLKKKNYKVSALSNSAKEWFDFKRQKFDLDKYFDVIVASGYVGVAKPDPEIYKIILNKLNVKAEECLFIDNKEKCLSPARKIGVKTILFTNQTELERKLLDINICF
jgi:HAD superfamily hydrolase (TIGR01509 family)